MSEELEVTVPEQPEFDVSFEIVTNSTFWGGIEGDIQLQTDLQNVLDAKQDTLTAGDNITIEDNVISATDTTYTAGEGISIEDNVISNTQTSAEWGNIEGDIQDQTDLIDLIDTKIDIEATARENNDLLLQNGINTLNNDLTAEISNRGTADGILQGNIDTLSGTVTNNYNTLDGKISNNKTAIDNHKADKNNPHEVTKAQVGLGNCDNTSDADKPVSTAQQTALDGKVDKLSTKPTAGTYTKVDINAEGQVTSGTTLQASDIPSLNLTKISDVTTTANELNQLHEAGAVKSDFEKLHAVTASATELNTLDGITASTTELNYIDGVTSSIQSQLNGKQPTIIGGATTITSNNLTTGRTLVSDSNGKVAVSDITATELGYLDGVTSNVQSQIGDITDLIPADATTSNQLADKEFVNSSISTNTANFIGTFIDVPALEAYSGTVTNNDYAFVVNGVITDNGNDWATFNDLDAYDKSLLTNFDYAWVINGSNFDLYRFDILNQEWGLRVSNTSKSAVTLNNAYNRYKATVSGSTVSWEFEYTLNNSSFTAAQWAAINSFITADTKVTHTANTAVGNSTTPVYVGSDGAVSPISYTIEKSVPSNAEFTDTTYTIATGSSNGTISVAVDGETPSDVSVYGLGSAAYTPSTDYATASQGSKADTAIQSVTTGSANGTISVDGSDVSVYGLGSAAYTNSSAYATSAQGTKADSAVQLVTTGSTNGTIDVDGSDVAVYGLGSAAYTNSSAYATATQGGKADTAVQSITTGSINGTISVDGTDVSVYGLGSAAYTASTAYATSTQGGKADSAIQTVKVNGSALTPDANKAVDISNMQTTTNLVTSVSSSSTDSQYTSAKLFYDTVGNIETLLSQV